MPTSRQIHSILVGKYEVSIQRTYKPNDRYAVPLGLSVLSSLMNQINPRKLIHSKWTVMNPVNKEKHFLVTEVEFDEDGVVVSCNIEAIMSKRVIAIEWQDLKDVNSWAHGWR